MLEDIKKLIPEMDNNDKNIIYNGLLERNKSKSVKTFNCFKNKFAVALTSFVVLLAVLIPVGFNLFNQGRNNPQPDLGEEGPDIDAEIPYYNLNGTQIEFFDCYFGNNSDILILYFPDITLHEIYIKELDVENKIINVEITNDNKKVTFSNSVYTVDLYGLKEAYITIHFEKGTLEKNIVTKDNEIVDDELNVDYPIDEDVPANDEEHVNQKTNVTTLTFLCSNILPDSGYEKITYSKNYDYINSEPKIYLVGTTTSLLDAMNTVDIKALLSFKEYSPNTITYNKTNKKTEVFYGYGTNNTITVRALIVEAHYDLKSIANEYIDTDLYQYKESDDLYIDENMSLMVDYYYCYKNEEDLKFAYAVTSLDVEDSTYYYIIGFNLLGENASLDLKDILYEMEIIQN